MNKFTCRIKFSKLDRMKFIGHLDLQTLFQRAVKRARLPILYSQGFNPHQIMSFALPLPLGTSSYSEYVEIGLAKEIDAEVIVSALNNTLPQGIKVVSAKYLKEGEKNAAASVAAAMYEIAFPENICISNEMVQNILNKSEIIMEKKSKGVTKQVNVRPLIYDISLTQNINCIQCTVCAGSSQNLKPDIIAKLLYLEINAEFLPNKIKYFRKSLFKKLENGKLIEL